MRVPVFPNRILSIILPATVRLMANNIRVYPRRNAEWMVDWNGMRCRVEGKLVVSELQLDQ